MFWMIDAARIYDAVYGEKNSMNGDADLPFPVAHTEANAHVEVTLDGNGKFLAAAMVSKKDAVTLLPCTEESGSRAGVRPVPHPLCDKLQYLAPNFRDFGGEVTAGFANDHGEPHGQFMRQLGEWCGSEFANAKVQAVQKYLAGGTLLGDLQERLGQVLFENNKFRAEFPDKKNYATGAPQDAVVRWRVQIPGDVENKLWRDTEVQRSWGNYYNSLKSRQKADVCYVTGKTTAIASLHPSRLRHAGDKARLISQNDNSGFTFRGRFSKAEEACRVSFMLSQKAHNALRWLVARQGRKFGECAYVTWGCGENGDEPPLSPFSDTEEIAPLENGGSENETQLDCATRLAAERHVSLQQIFSKNLMQRMAGYKKEPGNPRNIHIVALDAATPGRMSLVMDRDLEFSRVLENMERWHSHAAWFQNFGQVVELDADGNKKKRFKRFIGAPTPIDIAKAAYGSEPNSKLITATVNRVLDVIIDARDFPCDLLDSCVNRVFRRSGCESWEWEKNLGIACSLYRFTNYERNESMSYDPNRPERDYHYGALLALAEVTEKYSLEKQSEEKRPTNAERLFEAFANQPFVTWQNIEIALQPYLRRLRSGNDLARGIAGRFDKLSNEIIASFKQGDFENNERLSGLFLLGYHCLRRDLYLKKEKEDKGKADEPSDKISEQTINEEEKS